MKANVAALMVSMLILGLIVGRGDRELPLLVAFVVFGIVGGMALSNLLYYIDRKERP